MVRGRIVLKIVRRIQERPELLHSYNRIHVRLRLADRTVVMMPDRTFSFILNEYFDTL